MKLKLLRMDRARASPLMLHAHNRKGESLTVILWLWWMLRINWGRDRRYDYK